jgi:hypothetical protein
VPRLKAELEALLSQSAVRRSVGTGAPAPRKQDCRPPSETATWLLSLDGTITGITGITEDVVFTVVYSAITGSTLSSLRRLKIPGSQDLRGDRRSAHTATSAGSPARYPCLDERQVPEHPCTPQQQAFGLPSPTALQCGEGVAAAGYMSSRRASGELLNLALTLRRSELACSGPDILQCRFLAESGSTTLRVRCRLPAISLTSDCAFRTRAEGR